MNSIRKYGFAWICFVLITGFGCGDGWDVFQGIDCNPDVEPPANLLYQGIPFTFYTGRAIAPASPSYVGKADSFSVNPGLPAGLVIDSSTGVISGTPSAASTAAEYLVTAGNSAGSTTSAIRIEVRGAPSALSYPGSHYVYYTGEVIVPLTPAFSGFVSTFASTPVLPAGLTIDAATGIIAGTPAQTTPARIYTISASNPAGSVSFDLYLEVLPRKSEILAGIAVSPGSASVLTGDTVQFNATCSYLDGSSMDCSSSVAWSSDPDSVAVVDGSGLATATAAGQAAIAASIGGDISNQAVLAVTQREITDFGISSMVLDNPPAYMNDNVVVCVEVKNNGTSRVDDASIGLTMSIKKNGVQIGGISSTQDGPVSLDPGAVRQFCMGMLYHPEPGSYEAAAEISLGGSMYGRDEDSANNSGTLAITVLNQSRPGTSSDLAFQNIGVEDHGTSHRLVFEIKNIGTDPKTCNYNTEVQVSVRSSTRTPFEQTQMVLPAWTQMAPGEVKPFVFSLVDGSTGGRLPRGEYMVKLWTTNFGGTFCEEADMNNNLLSVPLMVDCSTHEECQEPPADFGISSMVLDNPPAYMNDNVVVCIDVKNNGTARIDDASIGLTVTNSKNGVPMGGSMSTQDGPLSLDPGAVWQVCMSVFWHPDPAAYETRAEIALGGSMYGKDTDQSNNVQTLSFEVLNQRRPGTNSDLVFRNILVEDLGTSHRLTFDLLNAGTDPKTCNYNTEVQVTARTSTRTPFTQTQMVLPAWSQMAPGEAKSFIFDMVDTSTGVRMPDGVYTVELWAANFGGTFCEELDLNNNYTTVTLQVE